MLKRLFTALFLFFYFFTFSQQEETHSFGKILDTEKKLISYEKDTTANAVVLYEKGDCYFKVINNYIKFIKEYHVKIKILDKKGFKHGTISIPFYHNDNSSESITDIQAMTHNNGVNKYLKKELIYTKDLSERWKEITFTFPDIREGSILEYKYKHISPFFYNLTGWEFQSDIPKIYSEFNAEIPANYIYNRSLLGSLKLNTNESKIKKKCFYIDGYPKPADCEVLKYAMKNIPAFNEEEEYMLAASNYKSKIEFEISQHFGFNGEKTNYTRSWEDVDKEFKTDKDIGRQLNKKNFFEKNIPLDLIGPVTDTLERAKKLYEFVQNHYSWNEKNSTYGKARVKKAFNDKKGNAWEINMSLINLLNASGIKSNMMLTSTRKNGLPKRSHPVMSDFNYILSKTVIGGKTYLLDATDKFIPFGYLPLRTLNHYGRVMDFKKESYWEVITPNTKNKINVRGTARINLEENLIEGKYRLINTGYYGIETQEEIDDLSDEDYLTQLEDNSSENFEIIDYSFDTKLSKKDVTIETISYQIATSTVGDKIYLNPFYVHFAKTNPFLSEERNFPIDFGYSRAFNYTMTIEIPEGYSISELPENKAIRIGENLATLRFGIQDSEKNITLSFDLSINEPYILSENYEIIKEFFSTAVDIQNNTLIILEKTK